MEPTMLHTHAHTEGLFPTIRKNRPDLVLVAIMLALIVAAIWAMRTTSPPALLNEIIRVQPGSGSNSTAADRAEGLPTFEQKTQALVASDSAAAFEALLLSLKASEPLPSAGSFWRLCRVPRRRSIRCC